MAPHRIRRLWLRHSDRCWVSTLIGKLRGCSGLLHDRFYCLVCESILNGNRILNLVLSILSFLRLGLSHLSQFLVLFRNCTVQTAWERFWILPNYWSLLYLSAITDWILKPQVWGHRRVQWKFQFSPCSPTIPSVPRNPALLTCISSCWSSMNWWR